jgi:hypothetical protein
MEFILGHSLSLFYPIFIMVKNAGDNIHYFNRTDYSYYVHSHEYCAPITTMYQKVFTMQDSHYT